MACGNRNKQDIDLLNGVTFHTEQSELITDIDSAGKKPYLEYFNNLKEIQVPLFRIVKADGYTIYLGMPYHTSLKSMAAARQASADADTVLMQQETPVYFYRQYRKGDLYLTEYIRSIDSASMIGIFAMTTNAQTADSLFVESKLAARIIQ